MPGTRIATRPIPVAIADDQRPLFHRVVRALCVTSAGSRSLAAQARPSSAVCARVDAIPSDQLELPVGWRCPVGRGDVTPVFAGEQSDGAVGRAGRHVVASGELLHRRDGRRQVARTRRQRPHRRLPRHGWWKTTNAPTASTSPSATASSSPSAPRTKASTSTPPSPPSSRSRSPSRSTKSHHLDDHVRSGRHASSDILWSTSSGGEASHVSQLHDQFRNEWIMESVQVVVRTSCSLE
jgi:hypothetical protein